ncbi:hypothetical protein [Alicyclobacillus macrosporangiidus]|uniref:Uncharacterized protein n=1 Tax=Alicyclobacillus macrosporangiidus TaxID=392015 RepID=A0A1I7IRG4_9BACL|nr:hypothetical protein [Alicyclobacillus macrosporangiidus]SFU75487.1 hypothetical protein SAMN05421543_10760 [Alicyclobacillus macrosporangiidus]
MGQTAWVYLVLVLLAGAAWLLSRRMGRVAGRWRVPDWLQHAWGTPQTPADAGAAAEEAERIAAVLEDIHRELAGDGTRLRADVAVALECMNDEIRSELARLREELADVRTQLSALQQALPGCNAAPAPEAATRAAGRTPTMEEAAAVTGMPEEVQPGPLSGLADADAERYFRILEAWQAGKSKEQVAMETGVSLAEVDRVVDLMTRPGTGAM